MKGDVAAFARLARQTYADTLVKYGASISYVREGAEKARMTTEQQPNRTSIVEDFDR